LRQRKDKPGEKNYSISIMNVVLAISETSAANLLAATPKAVRFFIEQGTECAVCSLARFCTLKDVITIYDLDENRFLEELAKLNIQKS